MCVYALVLSRIVVSRLVLSRLVFSCLVLRASGRMFRVSLLRCLVCLALSLFVLSVVCVVLCFVCEFVFVLGCLVRFHCLAVWLVCLFGFTWACVGLCVLGGGEGVYASNAPPCVRAF